VNDRLASLLVRTVARTVIWLTALIGAVVKTVRAVRLLVAKDYHRLYGLMKTITDDDIHD
jgi:hypothetical protein